MHKKALGLAAAMLIIAVIGFAFMGVAAAGSNNRGAKPTKTPKPEPTRNERHLPASIQLTPDPLQIACDGVEASTLMVRVTDARGKTVPNGTVATFSVDYGVAQPSQTETRKGEAKTNIVLSRQAASSFSGAFATVRVGDIEASIRIRCDGAGGCAQFPTSPPCQPPDCPASPPTSPPCDDDPDPCPTHPMSPPCLTATPNNPNPCPNGAPVSPPCLTATPTVPDPCSDPGAPFSPPCGTPTPTPNAPARFAIDCDLSSAGIQQDCDYPLDTAEIKVGIVLVNDSGESRFMASFQFDLVNPRKDLLFPPPVIGTFYDANPDFNDALNAEGNAWDCEIFPLSNDTGTGAPGTTVSRLGCLVLVQPPPGSIVPANGAVLLATVSFDVTDGAPASDIRLGLTQALAADEFGMDFTDCYFPPGLCTTATIHLFNPLLTPLPGGTDTPTPITNITPTPAP